MDLRRLFGGLLGLGVLLTVPQALAAETTAGTDNQGQIPIEWFAKPAQYKDMIVSPDGRYIAATYEVENNEVKLAILTSDLKKVLSSYGFGENKHIQGVAWIGKKRLIFRMAKTTGYLDNKGREAFVVATNVDGSQRIRLNEQGYSGWSVVDPLISEERYILVAKRHFADGGEIKVMRLDTVRNDMRLVDDLPAISQSMKPGLVQVATDNEGRLRLAVARDLGKNEYDLDDDTFQLFYRNRKGAWNQVNVDAKRKPFLPRLLGFGPKNKLIFFISNHDMPKSLAPRGDTRGLFYLNTDTGEIVKVYRHPEVDVLGGIYGPKGEVIGFGLEPGYPEQHFLFEDNRWVKLDKAIAAAFPGQKVSVSYARNGEKGIVYVRSDRNPGEFYMYDSHNKKAPVRFLAAARPDVVAKRMARVEPFKMKARDGVLLYGFLTIPNVENEKNLPMVVMPHGGPYGPFDRWAFNPYAQLLASRGYLVLQVNFRGSGGYGQDFEENAHRQWGRQMQDDVTDATLWAVKEGLADRDRLCMFGGSYGGYASLMGVVKEPDLYKCAIPEAGVYSLPLMWQKGDFWQNPKAAEQFLTDFLGKDEAELRAYSPAFHVDRIKAALFFIHGKNDVRVPIEHLDVTRQELDKIGKPYKVMVREEGHGFILFQNRMDQFKAMLEFLKDNIGPGAPLKH
jgi:pimeloyl-ACP methyl ester carboxylesterase